MYIYMLRAKFKISKKKKLKYLKKNMNEPMNH